MARQLLPLCSIQKLATRDGWVGATARLYLPFYTPGYWFASGQTYTFPRSTIAQDTKITFSGTVKPNTFVKDYGVCLRG